MNSQIFLTVLTTIAVLCTGTANALPASGNSTAGVSADNSAGVSTKRQFTSSEIPTAATGINGGNVANPLQSLALMQQLQASAGNNPVSLAAELAAESQEAIQAQKHKQQQSLLAAVQAQQQHVAAAQAAINHQNMVNRQNGPTNPLGGLGSVGVNNVQAMQLQQQLNVEKQNLLVQQQLLQEQVKPESQQLPQQQILMAQLLRNPGANQAQLLEQIRQQQTKQQAELVTQSMLQPTSMQSTLGQLQQSLLGVQQQPGMLQAILLRQLYAQQQQPSLAMTELAGGLGVSNRLGLANNPAMVTSVLTPALAQQQQQLILLRRMLLLRQLAMMNSYVK